MNRLSVKALTTASLVAALLGLSSAAPARASTTDTLYRGSSLYPNAALYSANGCFQAIMQGDGNFVVYAPGHRAIWAEPGSKRVANSIVMLQGDSNLVVIAPGNHPVWAAGTNGSGAVRLIQQDDGNLVLYNAANKAVWSSKTDIGGCTPSNSYDTAKAEAAIAWFQARAGSTAYEGMCELAVENAFGTSGQFATAYSDWLNNGQTKHTDYQNAPRGTLVFYDTGSAGHVAISLGNGQVISTSAGGHIGVEPIGYFVGGIDGPAYGWTASPWR